ncbi:MAG: hypothetical protein ACERKX_09430 [Anaerolineales bacterium]
MGSFIFWQRWLLVFAVLLILFGIGMVFFNTTSVFDTFFNDNINPAFWGSEGPDPTTLKFQSWVYGLLGATIAGWGVFVFFLVKIPFAQRKKWAWNCMFWGLLLWYVLDTGASIYYGVLFNALFNTAIFLAALIPLLFTRGRMME